MENERKRIIEQKSEESLTASSTDDQNENLSSTPSTTVDDQDLLTFDVEENTDRNTDYNYYIIDEVTAKNEVKKENAKDLILAAILKDDATQTKALIEQLTGNFNGSDDTIWLCKASEQCKLNVAKMLIENGVSVEVHKKDEWHPLHIAAFNGCDEVAKLLIENGADLNIKNGIGYSSLKIAIENGQDKITDLLIKNGAKTDIDDLWYTEYVARHTTEYTDSTTELATESTTENDVIEKFIETDKQKDKDNVKDMILDAISKDDGKQTENLIEDLIAGYLKIAAEQCKPKVAKMLIQNGVNVNVSYGEWKWRPLHVTTYSDCEEVARILIENGADINVKTGTGFTALHLAARNGGAKIVDLLIKNGADTETKDSNGFSGLTALEWALMRGYDDVVKVFTDNGANKAKTDSDYIY
ncbi:ankyrin-1-like [Contarinia nasturtii]|uniref:ankyrin-1-like n=1 Tax=Contarinia nasturtii TaxID=265458 RepID=UPI0012D4434C|nr:ankyrin-1-like [Contarinia nasturtii]